VTAPACLSADDKADELDALEVNECLVRLSVLYGPLYVSLCSSVVCVCCRYSSHGSHRDHFGLCRADVHFMDDASLEDDEGLPGAFFEFLQYLYTHRPEKLRDELTAPTHKQDRGSPKKVAH
jgi:hypothetical protein